MFRLRRTGSRLHTFELVTAGAELVFKASSEEAEKNENENGD